MPIDDALDAVQKQDELKELKEFKKHAEEKSLEREKKIKELSTLLNCYKKMLDEHSVEREKEIIKAHLRGLSNFWPENDPKDEYDEMTVKLVSDPDFIDIYFNTLVIKDGLKRHEYVAMKCLQKEIMDMCHDRIKFFDRLKPLGLNLICPYFEYDENKKDIMDKCLMDGNKIYTLCQGKHYLCSVFKNLAGKFATGELPYIKPPKLFKSPPIILSILEQQQLERKLLEENESYWRGDA